MNDVPFVYCDRALECLAGARSELANGRFNKAAKSAYYAAFNAAIFALLKSGISSGAWAMTRLPSRAATDDTFAITERAGNLMTDAMVDSNLRFYVMAG